MTAVEIFDGDLPASARSYICTAPMVAWDIETSGLRWDSDKIATCQLDVGTAGTCVVRGIQTRPPNLCKILSDPCIAKVFHHAPFDLRFMTYHWGVTPRNILCTKVASRILNPATESEPHSLKALLRNHLGIQIDKSERLSNWLTPNLTEQQINYAAEDVRHLVPLLNVLQKELNSSGLIDLYSACCEFLPARVQLEVGRWPDIFKY